MIFLYVLIWKFQLSFGGTYLRDVSEFKKDQNLNEIIPKSNINHCKNGKTTEKL